MLHFVESKAIQRLSDVVDSVGITSFTLEDDVYMTEPDVLARHGVSERWSREMVLGDGVRDWASNEQPRAIFPYDEDFKPIDVEEEPGLLRLLWPYRTNLSNSLMFGGQTKVEAGLKWTEYSRLTTRKLQVPRRSHSQRSQPITTSCFTEEGRFSTGRLQSSS